nr:putative late blight resistance protein homolog R1B-14 [Ipomoea trifida]
MQRLCKVDITTNAALILGIKDQVEDLVREVRSFQAYLTEAARNESWKDNAVLVEVERSIRNVARDAEDAIDKYIVERRIHKAKPAPKRWAEKAVYYTKVNLSAREIESFKERAKKIRNANPCSIRVTPVQRLCKVDITTNAALILGIKDQVEDLVRELRSFQAYLTEAARNESWKDNAVLVEVERSIRNVARDAEDAIDKYIVERRIHKAKPAPKRWAEKAVYYTKVNLSVREIESFKERAKKIRNANPCSIRATPVQRLCKVDITTNAALILGIKDQVEDLVRELRSFQAYLTEAARNESWKDNAVLVEVERSIRNVARDAEDAIDKYIVERMIHKAKPAPKRWAEKAVYYTKVNLSAREIESFKERAKKIRNANPCSIRATPVQRLCKVDITTNAALILGIKDQVEDLVREVRSFQAYLTEAARNESWKDNAVLVEVERSIRNVARDAEDAIDKYIVERRIHKAKPAPKRWAEKAVYYTKVNLSARVIESFKERAKKIRNANPCSIRATPVQRLCKVDITTNAALILGIKDQVEDLVREVRSFQAYLTEAARNESWKDNAVLVEVERSIRNVARDAEDAIDKYIVERMIHKAKPAPKRWAEKAVYYTKVNLSAREIESFKERAKKIRNANPCSIRATSVQRLCKVDITTNAALILGIKDQVEDLVRELRSFQAYLTEAARNESWKDNAVLVEVERSIRNVARDAEDAIDKYIVERRIHKAKPAPKRWAEKAVYYIKVNLSAREIESFKERAKKIRNANPCSIRATPVQRLCKVDITTNAALILGIKDQVEDLVRELMSFQAYLTEAARNESWKDNAVLVEVERSIRNVARDAEDAINKYIVERRIHKAKPAPKRWAEKAVYYTKVNLSAREIESFKERAKKIRNANPCSIRATPVQRLCKVDITTNAALILGIKDQVEGLVRDVRSFQAYLTEAARNESWKDNAVLVEVERSIRKVARDAEDAIDKYIVERRIHKAKPAPKRWAEKAVYYTKVNLSAREIESFKERAKKIRNANPCSIRATPVQRLCKVDITTNAALILGIKDRVEDLVREVRSFQAYLTEAARNESWKDNAVLVEVERSIRNVARDAEDAIDKYIVERRIHKAKPAPKRWAEKAVYYTKVNLSAREIESFKERAKKIRNANPCSIRAKPVQRLCKVDITTNAALILGIKDQVEDLVREVRSFQAYLTEAARNESWKDNAVLVEVERSIRNVARDAEDAIDKYIVERRIHKAKPAPKRWAEKAVYYTKVNLSAREIESFKERAKKIRNANPCSIRATPVQCLCKVDITTNAALILGIKDQVEDLVREVRSFQAYLTEVARNESWKDNAVLVEVERSIRNVSRDAEDAIDKYIVERRIHKAKPAPKRWAEKAVYYTKRLCKVDITTNAALILGIKDQAEDLVRELRSFQAYLTEAARNESWKDNAVLVEVERSNANPCSIRAKPVQRLCKVDITTNAALILGIKDQVEDLVREVRSFQAYLTEAARNESWKDNAVLVEVERSIRNVARDAEDAIDKYIVERRIHKAKPAPKRWAEKAVYYTKVNLSAREIESFKERAKKIRNANPCSIRATPVQRLCKVDITTNAALILGIKDRVEDLVREVRSFQAYLTEAARNESWKDNAVLVEVERSIRNVARDAEDAIDKYIVERRIHKAKPAPKRWAEKAVYYTKVNLSAREIESFKERAKKIRNANPCSIRATPVQRLCKVDITTNAALILGIKDRVEDLVREVRSFQAYLTEAARNESWKDNAVLVEVERSIRNVARDAEDAIDKYIVERRIHKAKPAPMRWAEKAVYYTKVNLSAREIESFKERAKKIRNANPCSIRATPVQCLCKVDITTNAALILGIKDQVEDLVREVRSFQAYLTEVARNESWKDNAVLVEVERSIRNVSRDAEDAIDKYIVERRIHKAKPAPKRWAEKAVYYTKRLCKVDITTNAALILGIKDQAEDLVRELRSFQAYLTEAARNESWKDNAVLVEVERSNANPCSIRAKPVQRLCKVDITTNAALILGIKDQVEDLVREVRSFQAYLTEAARNESWKDNAVLVEVERSIRNVARDAEDAIDKYIVERRIHKAKPAPKRWAEKAVYYTKVNLSAREIESFKERAKKIRNANPCSIRATPVQRLCKVDITTNAALILGIKDRVEDLVREVRSFQAYLTEAARNESWKDNAVLVEVERSIRNVARDAEDAIDKYIVERRIHKAKPAPKRWAEKAVYYTKVNLSAREIESFKERAKKIRNANPCSIRATPVQRLCKVDITTNAALILGIKDRVEDLVREVRSFQAYLTEAARNESWKDNAVLVEVERSIRNVARDAEDAIDKYIVERRIHKAKPAPKRWAEKAVYYTKVNLSAREIESFKERAKKIRNANPCSIRATPVQRLCKVDITTNAALILGIKDRVEDLVREVRSFQAYLTEAARNESWKDNAVLVEVERSIRNVARDAEDAIDKYIVERRIHKAKPAPMRWAEKAVYYTKVNLSAREIESFKERAKKIRNANPCSIRATPVQRLCKVDITTNAALILGIKDRVEDLVREVRSFQAYLTEAARNESWKDNAVLVEVERSIRNVARDAEDAIDKYIVERRIHKAKPAPKRWAEKAVYYTKVNLSAREIESFKERAKKIRNANPCSIRATSVQRLCKVDITTNAALILGIKDQVQDLVREVRSFQAYLTEAARNESWKDNAVLVEVERSIRNVARDAEDAIDKYIVERRIHKAKPAPKRWAEKAVYYIKVNLSAREIESFKEKAKKIRNANPCSIRATPVQRLCKVDITTNAALILGIKDRVEDLVREVRSFQAYLTEAARNESWKDNAVLVEVERSIRNVARDAEDAIDKYIVERRIHKAKPAPKRWAEKAVYYTKVNLSVREIESFKERAKKIRQDYAHPSSNANPCSIRATPVQRLCKVDITTNAALILGIKDQAYLTEAARNESWKDNAVLVEVERSIRNVARDAEDAIDKYIVERRIHKAKPAPKRWAEKAVYYTKVNLSAREIESFKERAKKIRQDYAHPSSNANPCSIRATPVQRLCKVDITTNAALILGIKDQVEDLVRELRSFQAYLTEAARNESWKDNAVLVEVERSIRNVARDAEDAIDKYIVERRIHKAKPAPKKWAEKAVYYTKVNLSAREIESFKERAKKIRNANPCSIRATPVQRLCKVDITTNAALILGIKDQVEDLVRELRSFQAYLTEAARNESWKDNAVLVEVERSIRNVARDAEDAIDKYIVERRIHKVKQLFS